MWITYKIAPRHAWSWDEIRDRLVSIAGKLPDIGFLDVKAVQEFHWIRDTWHPEALANGYRPAFLFTHRCVQLPELPDLIDHQPPSRIMAFIARPTAGADAIAIGYAEYPECIRYSAIGNVHWRKVVENSRSYKAAFDALRSFAKTHRLRLLHSKSDVNRWFSRVGQVWDQQHIGAAVISHYCWPKNAPKPNRLAIQFTWLDEVPVLLLARDPLDQIDVEALCAGLRWLAGSGVHRVVGDNKWKGRYYSTLTHRGPHPVKSRYDLVANFLCNHQRVCAALKICEEHDFDVEVDDEAGFWGNWETDKLLQYVWSPPPAFDNIH